MFDTCVVCVYSVMLSVRCRSRCYFVAFKNKTNKTKICCIAVAVLILLLLYYYCCVYTFVTKTESSNSDERKNKKVQ